MTGEAPLKFYVRASSVAEFFDCPARWAARNLFGQRRPATAPAAIGTAVHRSTAEYDKSRLDENPARWLSIDDTADAVVETLKDPGYEVDWTGSDIKFDKAVKIGLGCHTRYCNDIAPFSNYSEVEFELAELELRITIDDGRIVTLGLTGTLDRLREEVEEYRLEDGTPMFRVDHGISDVKTGARAISQPASRHKAQIAVYELLAEVSVPEVNEIRLPGEIIALQTSSSSYGAATKHLTNTREALVGRPGEKGLMHHMAQMLASGDFYGNASSFLCSERYCPAWSGCVFR